MVEQVNSRLAEARKATQWKPGKSGNPKGRTPNSVTALLKATPDADKKVIADKLTELVKNGELKAIDRRVIDN